MSNLETLVNWYSAVCSADSTNEQRAQATRNIEEAKASLGWGAADAGLQIAERASTVQELVFFGLLLVEDAVQRHYPGTLDVQGREQFRAKLVAMAQSEAASGHRASEKLGQILADVAKQDWPQVWPDFFPQLLSAPPLMVTKALRILFEDIKDSTTSTFNSVSGTSRWDCKVHIPAARKRELITSVRAVSPDLLAYLARDLQSENASISTVQCLTALLELVDIRVITDSGIVGVVLQQFASIDTSTPEWQAVCACVRELCAQPSAQTAQVAAALCHVASGVAAQHHSRPLACPTAHEALRSLAACFETALAYKRASDYQPLTQVLPDVVAAACSMLKVPSLAVAGVIIPSLLNLATAGMVDGMADMPTLLREALADNISNPDNEEGLEFPHQSWSEDVFDGDEWRACLTEARKDGRNLLILVTKAYRAPTLQTLTAYMQELHTLFATRHERDELDDVGELVPCSRQAVAWESAAYVAAACLAAPLGDASVAELAESVKKCLAVASPDAVVVMAQASLIGGLPCLYRQDQQLLLAAIDKLFQLMRHRRSYEANSTILSPATSAARMKVMNTFAKLCSTLATNLAPLMEPLLSSASGLVGGELQSSEVSSICEGLTSVSNSMPDDAQAKVLEILTQPALGMLGELSHLATPNALAQLLQQTDPGPSRRLLYLASTLAGIFRHTKGSMLRPLAEKLVEPVLTALKTVAQLYGPAQACLPPQYHAMLAAKPEQEEWAFASDAEQQHSALVDAGRDFLTEIQCTFLDLLGGVAGVTSALHEHYVAMDVGGIAGSMSLPALRAFFFHFAIPFVYSCPPQFVRSAGSFVQATCRMAALQIDALYQQTRAAGEPPSPEVHEIAMLSVDLLVRVSKARQTPAELATTQHLLGDATPVTGLLLLVASTFAWADDAVTTKALAALRKVLSVLVPVQGVHRHLYVLYALCLRRLQGAKLKETLGSRLGHDNKQDKLLDGCVVTVSDLLHALGPHHDIFVASLLSAGVVTGKQLAQEVAAEPQEGLRVSAVRSVLASYVAGKGTPVQVEVPSFAPLPCPDRSPYDAQNCVPIDIC
eukprot:Rhum_TRINITY_DN20792_c0_g1::Rhum_TRINITY_DN20792_c0_g1_i1::g.172158::m.172158